MNEVECIVFGLLAFAFVVMIVVMNNDIENKIKHIRELGQQIEENDNAHADVIASMKIEQAKIEIDLTEALNAEHRAREYGDYMDDKYRWHDMTEHPGIDELVIIMRTVMDGERIFGTGYYDGKEWHVKKPALLKGNWCTLPEEPKEK